MAKNSADKDTIRKIWLAGIGAYGRAFSEAKGAVDSLSGKGSEVFDELVKKGEVLEAVGKYKAEELLGKGKAAVPDFELDDRIAKMRARLSGVADSGSDRLSARVDAMEAKLDAILAKLDIGDADTSSDGPKVKPKPRPKARKTTAKTAKPASTKRMTTQRTTDAKASTKAKVKPKPKPKTAKKSD